MSVCRRGLWAPCGNDQVTSVLSRSTGLREHGTHDKARCSCRETLRGLWDRRSPLGVVAQPRSGDKGSRCLNNARTGATRPLSSPIRVADTAATSSLRAGTYHRLVVDVPLHHRQPVGSLFRPPLDASCGARTGSGCVVVILYSMNGCARALGLRLSKGYGASYLNMVVRGLGRTVRLGAAALPAGPRPWRS